MSKSYLLVEGKLDQQCLTPLLAGNPTVERGGSKNSLKPEARTRAILKRQPYFFLRDRDFDYDPSKDTSQPQPLIENGKTIGWHWCRHEIENYFLEPQIIHAAIHRINLDNYQTQLKTAAYNIRFYEAARWSIGIARRSLPPHYELQTRPSELKKKEIAIFNDCSEPATSVWLQNTTSEFYSKISKALNKETTIENYQNFQNLFTQDFCQDINNILVWFSGKDLLAAMNTWCINNGFPHPSDFRAQVADWCHDNPEEVVNLLPEWQALRHFFWQSG